MENHLSPRRAQPSSPAGCRPLPACLLAAAALFTSTQGLAQNSAQVYGVLDFAIGSHQASGGARTTQLSSGNLTTSYLGFRANEDLGGGLSASVTLETYLRGDTGESSRYSGDSFWSRNANVGLSGGFGTVKLGRIGTPLFSNTLVFNPLAASFGFSPVVRNTYTTGRLAGDSGWNNAIGYTSPRLGGLTLELMHAAKETAQRGNSSARLAYSQGAFAAGLVVQTVGTAFSAGKESAWQLGASYQLPQAKLFGQLGRIRETGTGLATTNSRDTISQLGVSVPVGAGTVLASWSVARTEGSLNLRRSFTTLGYDHRLSKRTDVYLMAMADTLRGQDRGTTLALGVRHAF